MARRGYSPEFCQRVLDLVASGRKVVDVARDLQISEQRICTWRRQSKIDQGDEAALTTGDRAELLAARRRIRELESELQIRRRAPELLKDSTEPKPGGQRSR